jgi:beta-glucanase (GH16 family)
MRNLWVIAILWFPGSAHAQTGLNSQWIAFNRASAPDSNLQCFRPNNVTVLGGNLVITTKRELATCSSFDLSLAAYRYTSGWVSMRNFHFLYGTVEFRAKFGGGMSTGAWPVVWMADASCQGSDPTGTDDNCNGQEIDIAEILHSDFTHVNQQIHVENFSHNDGCHAPATDTSKNFHVYQLLWSAGLLVFRIDGATTCTITQRYVPDAPMYVKINNFVGKFGGPVNDRSLPWVTLVDYVKVTQSSKVIFEDAFDPKDADHPSVSNRPNNSLLKVFWRWLPWALVICLVILISAIALSLRGSGSNVG